MKKVGIVLLVCSLLGSAAGAATDTTAAKQIDWLENAFMVQCVQAVYFKT